MRKMPTPGDCPAARQQAGVTTDDRAMLLPGQVRESPEVDIQPQVSCGLVSACVCVCVCVCVCLMLLLVFFNGGFGDIIVYNHFIHA